MPFSEDRIRHSLDEALRSAESTRPSMKLYLLGIVVRWSERSPAGDLWQVSAHFEPDGEQVLHVPLLGGEEVDSELFRWLKDWAEATSARRRLAPPHIDNVG
jgi:hypothetical protein